MILVKSSFLICFACIGIIYGANFFEWQLPRLQCFKRPRMQGCNQTFLSAYPNVSVSGTNATRAETHFFLFTRQNKQNPEFLHECGGKLPTNSKFNPKYKTEIFVHGFVEAVCKSAWMQEMKNELLKRGNYNVILVDWSWGNGRDYYDAAINVKIVAQQLAIVINNIKEQKGVGASSFHIIGQSLGAHISGITGQYTKVRRITGTDPAGPAFIANPPDEKLSRDDAELVDIIHTNSGDCMPNLGDIQPLGDADFYPNGGSKQPSCYPYAIQSLLKRDYYYGIIALIMPNICYHSQAIQFYKASINPGKCQFVGVECDCYSNFKDGKCRFCAKDGSNCAVMGMDFEKYYKRRSDNATHKYYLNTKLRCPYCDNNGIKLNGFVPETSKKLIPWNIGSKILG